MRDELRHALAAEENRETPKGQSPQLATPVRFDTSVGGSPPVDADARRIERAERRLLQIETALQRLEEGLYGQCVQCGRAIAQHRLQAIPYETRCDLCAGGAEATG